MTTLTFRPSLLFFVGCLVLPFVKGGDWVSGDADPVGRTRLKKSGTLSDRDDLVVSTPDNPFAVAPNTYSQQQTFDPKLESNIPTTWLDPLTLQGLEEHLRKVRGDTIGKDTTVTCDHLGTQRQLSPPNTVTLSLTDFQNSGLAHPTTHIDTYTSSETLKFRFIYPRHGKEIPFPFSYDADYIGKNLDNYGGYVYCLQSVNPAETDKIVAANAFGFGTSITGELVFGNKKVVKPSWQPSALGTGDLEKFLGQQLSNFKDDKKKTFRIWIPPVPESELRLNHDDKQNLGSFIYFHKNDATSGGQTWKIESSQLLAVKATPYAERFFSFLSNVATQLRGNEEQYTPLTLSNYILKAERLTILPNHYLYKLRAGMPVADAALEFMSDVNHAQMLKDLISVNSHVKKCKGQVGKILKSYFEKNSPVKNNMNLLHPVLYNEAMDGSEMCNILVVVDMQQSYCTDDPKLYDKNSKDEDERKNHAKADSAFKRCNAASKNIESLLNLGEDVWDAIIFTHDHIHCDSDGRKGRNFGCGGASSSFPLENLRKSKHYQGAMRNSLSETDNGGSTDFVIRTTKATDDWFAEARYKIGFPDHRGEPYESTMKLDGLPGQPDDMKSNEKVQKKGRVDASLDNTLKLRGFKAENTRLWITGTELIRCVFKGTMHALKNKYKATVLVDATASWPKDDSNWRTCETFQAARDSMIHIRQKFAEPTTFDTKLSEVGELCNVPPNPKSDFEALTKTEKEEEEKDDEKPLHEDYKQLFADGKCENLPTELRIWTSPNTLGSLCPDSGDKDPRTVRAPPEKYLKEQLEKELENINFDMFYFGFKGGPSKDNTIRYLEKFGADVIRAEEDPAVPSIEIKVDDQGNHMVQKIPGGQGRHSSHILRALLNYNGAKTNILSSNEALRDSYEIRNKMFTHGKCGPLEIFGKPLTGLTRPQFVKLESLDSGATLVNPWYIETAATSKLKARESNVLLNLQHKLISECGESATLECITGKTLPRDANVRIVGEVDSRGWLFEDAYIEIIGRGFQIRIDGEKKDYGWNSHSGTSVLRCDSKNMEKLKNKKILIERGPGFRETKAGGTEESSPENAELGKKISDVEKKLEDEQNSRFMWQIITLVLLSLLAAHAIYMTFFRKTNVDNMSDGSSQEPEGYVDVGSTATRGTKSKSSRNGKSPKGAASQKRNMTPDQPNSNGYERTSSGSLRQRGFSELYDNRLSNGSDGGNSTQGLLK